MGCPRCTGSLSAYALGARETKVCEECGWVGIETSLEAKAAADAAESWTEAMARAPDRQVTVARSDVGLPPLVTRESSQEDERKSPTGARQRQESASDEASALVDRIDGLEPDEAEQLAAAEITSLEELASADPGSLAAKTTLAESTLRAYSRNAAIQVVTAVEETPTASVDHSEQH